MIAHSARPVVAVLEARMSRELARLVEKHGGDPLCVPALRESPELSPEQTDRLIESLARGQHELVVFMTGVAVSLLFETADQIGRRPDLVSALKRMTTVCRGPKPTAALRGFGVPPTLTAREPFTTGELIDALAALELHERCVLLLHYGERSETLAETLLARGARLEEVWLYRWLMPEDTGGLERLVDSIVEGRVDALAITCQIQFRHLYQIAERTERARAFVRALNERVLVAAVGPTCEAVLRARGVRVEVVPDHPKMGPMVTALMRRLDTSAPRSDPSATERSALTN